MNKVIFIFIIGVFLVIASVLSRRGYFSKEYVQEMQKYIDQVRHISPSPRVEKIAQNSNIILYSPRINSLVGYIFSIRGKARVFENVIQIRLKNKRTGVEYIATSLIADAPDVGEFGNFTYIIDLGHPLDGSTYDLKKGDMLLLDVYHNSPKDGSEIDKLEVYTEFNPSIK